MIIKYVPLSVINEYVNFGDVCELVEPYESQYDQKQGIIPALLEYFGSDNVEFSDFLESIESNKARHDFHADYLRKLNTHTTRLLSEKIPYSVTSQYIPSSIPYRICSNKHQICTNCALKNTGHTCPICRAPSQINALQAVEGPYKHSIPRLIVNYVCSGIDAAFEITATALNRHDGTLSDVYPKLTYESEGTRCTEYGYEFDSSRSNIELYLNPIKLPIDKSIRLDIVEITQTHDGYNQKHPRKMCIDLQRSISVLPLLELDDTLFYDIGYQLSLVDTKSGGNILSICITFCNNVDQKEIQHDK